MPRIRKMRASDLAAVVAIERQITGSRRTSSLGRQLRTTLRERESICLVAEIGGDVAGFLVGDLRPWEFGEDRPVAWVKVVGVDPRHQGGGIGRDLGRKFLAEARTRGARRVKTLVDWDAGDVVAYFRSLGFDRSGAIVLDRKA
ncbi:MAG TPA: GNAT family N-acetyltransferase [Thermoplasmata archaeon]|nr:GNAT family N-acetyltransferase [Thermoplasmata archaeon]